MSWGRLDDTLHDHPKVEHLSLAAIGLWTKCLSKALRHSKTSPRPGFISTGSVKLLAGTQTTRLVRELTTPIEGKKFGMWEPTDGGWMIHDFTDYLPKQRDPEEASESGRKGAAAKWAKQGKQIADSHSNSQPEASQEPQLQPGSEPAETMANGMAKDGPRASRSAFPSRPVPEEQEQGLGGERQETLRALPATEPPTCSKHPDGDSDTPCAGCAKVRARRDRLESEHRAAEAERIRNCPNCEGMGFVLDAEKRPTRRKCDHRRQSA